MIILYRRKNCKKKPPQISLDFSGGLIVFVITLKLFVYQNAHKRKYGFLLVLGGLYLSSDCAEKTQKSIETFKKIVKKLFLRWRERVERKLLFHRQLFVEKNCDRETLSASHIKLRYSTVGHLRPAISRLTGAL